MIGYIGIVKSRRIGFYASQCQSAPDSRGTAEPDSERPAGPGPEARVGAGAGGGICCRAGHRSALELLAADGLIVRERGRGTRGVTRPGAAGKAVITFLLACRPLERCGAMWYLVRNMVQNLQRACEDARCGLELIPVSPSNNAHDVDPALFAHLNAAGRVIVYGDWFLPMLPRLIATNARILLVQMRDFRLDAVKQEYLAMPDNVEFLCPDIEMLYYQAVSRLADAGCRKIACLAPLGYTSDGQIRRGYLKGLADFTGEAPLLRDCREVFKHVTSFDELGRFLHGWQKNTEFDGLLYSADLLHLCEEYRLFNYETLRLPRPVQIVMTHLIPYQAALNPVFPVVQFENRIPAAAVRRLLAPAGMLPRIRVLEPAWQMPAKISGKAPEF